jgi:hypothetical protein
LPEPSMDCRKCMPSLKEQGIQKVLHVSILTA